MRCIFLFYKSVISKTVIDYHVAYHAMFRQSVRTLSTTALKAAELSSKVDMSNQYGVQLAKAQGHVNGFVGGESQSTVMVVR